jgi:hypothetical protein
MGKFFLGIFLIVFSFSIVSFDDITLILAAMPFFVYGVICSVEGTHKLQHVLQRLM